MAPKNPDLKPTGPPPQETKQDNGVNESKTDLLINYLSRCLTDEEFRSIFTHIGPIKASKIVGQNATGRRYGFGIIDYQDAGEAVWAIESLNGRRELDRTIKVSSATPGCYTSKRAKLYIRGRHKDNPLQKADKIFADFGKHIQFRVIGTTPAL